MIAPGQPERKSSLRRFAVRLFQGILALEVGFVLVLLLLWVSPQWIPLALALAGRSTICPLTDVWGAGDLRLELQAASERIQDSVRLLETDPAGFELWGTSEGAYWIPAGSSGSLATITAQQAVDQYGDGERTVQPGEIVLDGGAHVGIYVREALGRGAALVVAIEPAPANVECLRRNLVDEIAEGRVIIYPKGIWDEVDELPLWEDPDNSAADGFIHKDPDFESRHTIALTTIDLLVKELGLERVDLIKMDIKGAVARALRGGRGTLERFGPKLVIAAEDGDEAGEIMALLEELVPGYEAGCTSCSIVGAWRVVPDVLLLSRRTQS